MLCNNCNRQIGDAQVCPYCHQPADKGSPLHQLPEGTLLGDKYRIDRVLGEGGFGITYLGYNTSFGLPVAVKEYFPRGISYRNITVSNEVYISSGSDKDFYDHGKERFLKEATTLVRFGGEPGVVSAIDYLRENNTAYLIMEYLEGETLQQHLKKHGVMSADEAFSLLAPVMRTLEKIHAEGIIHRDNSPDNIMRLKDGSVKLMDFGAAREYVDDNRSMSVMLKKGYAPEEQYRRSGKQGPWTDVYALCATIYRCITGRTPYESLDRLEEDNLPLPSQLHADITPAYESILMYGLAVRRRDRCQSMTELTALIEQAKGGISPAVPAPDSGAVLAAVDAAQNATVFADDPNATAYADQAAVQKSVPPAKKQGKKKARVFGVISAVAVLLAALIVAGVLLVNKKAPDTADDTAINTSSAPAVQETVGDSPAIAAPTEQTTAAEDALSYEDLAGRTVLSAGSTITVGVKKDGTVIATDINDSYAQWGQNNVSSWTDITSVAAGAYHTVGLKKDGTVVTTRIVNTDMDRGQCDVGSWTDIEAISANTFHTVGLKKDGTVVSTTIYDSAWDHGQTDVGGWRDITAIATGMDHTVGLKSDGTVVAAGDNMYGQCSVEGWTDIVAIAAGSYHTVGLKKDGTVITTSIAEQYYLDYGQTDVGDWSDIVAIAASDWLTLGIRKDGTVVSTKISSSRYDSEQYEVDDWTDIVAISAAESHTVGLKKDGTVVSAGSKHFGQRNVDDWDLF